MASRGTQCARAGRREWQGSSAAPPVAGVLLLVSCILGSSSASRLISLRGGAVRSCHKNVGYDFWCTLVTRPSLCRRRPRRRSPSSARATGARPSPRWLAATCRTSRASRLRCARVSNPHGPAGRGDNERAQRQRHVACGSSARPPQRSNSAASAWHQPPQQNRLHFALNALHLTPGALAAEWRCLRPPSLGAACRALAWSCLFLRLR